MSTQISQEDHEEAIKELQEKYEKILEAGIAKGVAAALAVVRPTARTSSPVTGTSLFRPTYTSPIKNPLPKSSSAASPSLAASSSRASSPQTALDEALRARAIQQQPQEVAWNKRSLPKTTLASVTLLLKDFDVYKRKQGVKSLHDCCGVEFLTLLEGAMDVKIPDADDGSQPVSRTFKHISVIFILLSKSFLIGASRGSRRSRFQSHLDLLLHGKCRTDGNEKQDTGISGVHLLTSSCTFPKVSEARNYRTREYH